MDDLSKVLLGAALSISGGFIAQRYSEYLKIKETDREILIRIFEAGNLALAAYKEMHDGFITAVQLSTRFAEQANTMVSEAQKLRLSRHHQLALLIFDLPADVDYNVPNLSKENDLKIIKIDLTKQINSRLYKKWLRRNKSQRQLPI